MRQIRLILFILLILSPFAVKAETRDVPENIVLISVDSLKYENDQYLAVSFKNHAKWHTYWKNPGDAGLPINIKFQLDQQVVELEPMEWPAPKRYLEEGNMRAYGYEDQYSFFFKLSEAQKQAFNNKKLTIDGSWLVCKHLCVPGKKSVEGKYSDSHFTTDHSEFEIQNEELSKRLKELPKKVLFPTNLDLILAKNPTKDGLALYYNYTNLNNNIISSDRNLLTPYPIAPLTFGHEELYLDKQGNIYGKLAVDWDGEYQEPPINLPANGIFSSPYNLKFLFSNPLTKKVEQIEKSFTAFNLTSGQASEKFLAMLKKVDIKRGQNKEIQKIEVVSTEKEYTYLYYLFFAFLGGLILNFMPCVLPVISMKIFGLISHSSESKSRIMKHNMFYSLGVLFSFLALAIVVILFKQAGTYVGWGFQLQSPIFVSITIILLFTMTLNLFGLFEIMTPGGKSLGGMELSDSYTGDFFGGVLATILSTPCSAPFLGTALTFAFSSSSYTIVVMFLMIGLGLAFPFILTGFFPALISFFPKPGNWMNHLKKLLGFTLLLTVVWLFDVFVSQVDTTIQIYKLGLVLLLILISLVIKRKNNKFGWVLFLLPILVFTNIVVTPMEMEKTSNENSSSTLLKDKQKLGLSWEEFSEEKLQQYLSENQVVFIDFTAKWCFTCKVNEKIVLDTEGFKELVKQKNIKLLLADWTKRDEKLGKWLEDHGKVGIPAYFILDAEGRLNNLGETISLSKIKKYLN